MRRGRAHDIAIVGMGCRFPGAPDLFAFWANILANRDCTREVPADRWPLATFHDPESRANDRVACRRGGYLESPIAFDPAAHGIMPLAVAGGEPEQFLVLDAAPAALADAGLDPGPPRRPAGRGGHRPGELLQPRQPDPAPARPDRRPDRRPAGRAPPRVDERGSRAPPAGPEGEPAPVRGGDDPRPAHQRHRRTARGPARLGGASFVVDAASASSLVALDLGCRALVERRADLALVGGVYLEADVDFPLVFRPARRALALGRVTAVLGRRRRHDPGRGGRRRGPQAAARRRARRRPDLRGAQGGRAGQRRPGPRPGLAQRQGACPGDPPGLPRRGDRPGDRRARRGPRPGRPGRRSRRAARAASRLPAAEARGARAGRRLVADRPRHARRRDGGPDQDGPGAAPPGAAADRGARTPDPLLAELRPGAARLAPSLDPRRSGDIPAARASTPSASPGSTPTPSSRSIHRSADGVTPGAMPDWDTEAFLLAAADRRASPTWSSSFASRLARRTTTSL